MQCSAVQCSAVQCSAVQCSAVQCSAVHSAVQCSAGVKFAVLLAVQWVANGRGLGVVEQGRFQEFLVGGDEWTKEYRISFSVNHGGLMVLMQSEVQTLLSEASLKTSEGGAKNYPKLAHGRK